MRTVGPKPTDEPNRCDLRPVAPGTPEKALLLVSLLPSLPLYVVYFGVPRFALPNQFPAAPEAGRISLGCLPAIGVWRQSVVSSQ
jgi:hypothetical protein